MVEPSPLLVHRCRFVNYTPAAITAIAFPPLPLSHVGGRKTSSVADLVVGRTNGNIEVYEWSGSREGVYEARQAWVLRKTFAGPIPSKVESLVLSERSTGYHDNNTQLTVENFRLFSVGGGSELLEWDTVRGIVRRTISSLGGSIWSISVNPASTQLAMGCEDGSVQLLTIENDNLFHLRRLDRSKSRILSLSWGPVSRRNKRATEPTESNDESDDGEEFWVDSWLVAGCSDSSLRKYDLKTGHITDRIGTDKIRGERTLVWAVTVLGDGTIVSGDSLGFVKFWDSYTGTQLQSFQSHGADVLCLTAGPDGRTVYSSGIDQKTVQFSALSTPASGSAVLPSRRWAQTASKRMHSHDVRALAVWPPYSPIQNSHQNYTSANYVPIVVSGGLDASIAASPASLPQSTVKAKLTNPLATSVTTTFEDSYHRRILYSSGFGGASAVCFATQARLVLCLREAGATIWRIPMKMPNGADHMPTYEEVLDMSFNVKTNIVSGSLSNDGRWLVISDQCEVKLFSLTKTDDGGIEPKRIRDLAPASVSGLSPSFSGATSLVFTPDSARLIIGDSSSNVFVFDLSSAPPRLLRQFDQHRQGHPGIAQRVLKGRRQMSSAIDGSATASASNAAGTNAAITRMAISADGQWLASSDDSLQTHIFNLDTFRHHSQLPSAIRTIRALAFSPTAPAILLLGFSNNTFDVWDVEARQTPPWAQQVCGALPKHFTDLHDPLIGIAFPLQSEAGSRTPALFWGATWLCKVELSAQPSDNKQNKRRRGKDGKVTKAVSEESFKIFTQYRQILHVSFASEHELVVVERPLVDVLARLPPAYFKPKYGAS